MKEAEYAPSPQEVLAGLVAVIGERWSTWDQARHEAESAFRVR